MAFDQNILGMLQQLLGRQQQQAPQINPATLQSFQQLQPGQQVSPEMLQAIQAQKFQGGGGGIQSFGGGGFQGGLGGIQSFGGGSFQGGLGGIQGLLARLQGGLGQEQAQRAQQFQGGAPGAGQVGQVAGQFGQAGPIAQNVGGAADFLRAMFARQAGAENDRRNTLGGIQQQLGNPRGGRVGTLRPSPRRIKRPAGPPPRTNKLSPQQLAQVREQFRSQFRTESKERAALRPTMRSTKRAPFQVNRTGSPKGPTRQQVAQSRAKDRLAFAKLKQGRTVRPTNTAKTILKGRAAPKPKLKGRRVSGVNAARISKLAGRRR